MLKHFGTVVQKRLKETTCTVQVTGNYMYCAGYRKLHVLCRLTLSHTGWLYQGVAGGGGGKDSENNVSPYLAFVVNDHTRIDIGSVRLVDNISSVRVAVE